MKYVILDFGKVLAYPTTGNWDITPKFLELIDIEKMNLEKLKQCKRKYQYLLSEKIETLEEEYNMFVKFYDSILREYNYPNYKLEISEQIAYNRTYEYDKYKLYDNVKEELETLKEEYTLILLSDNWPCVIEFMKHYQIYDLFTKVYVSSIYGQEKKDGLFFDNPIKDFDIKPNEAIFIDDNEKLLDIALSKGFCVRLMDREGKNKNSKYITISNLNQIRKKNENEIKRRNRFI